MRLRHVVSAMAALMLLAACGQGDQPTAEPSPATPVPGPTATPSPSPSPTEDAGTEEAQAFVACLEDRGLEAEEGPSGDMQEQFQVGVGEHPHFTFQAVVLGYEDREQAAEDKDRTERGAGEIGASSTSDRPARP